MFEHEIELSFITDNIDEAKEKATDQLFSYDKKEVKIGDVKEIEDGKISIKVSYLDQYKEIVFPKEDFMYKHNIDLAVPTDNENYAKDVAKEQLEVYNKQNYKVIGSKLQEGKKSVLVSVSYFDKYDQDAVFLSDDMEKENGPKLN